MTLTSSPAFPLWLKSAAVVLLSLAVLALDICGCTRVSAQSPDAKSVGQCTNPLCHCEVGGTPCPCGVHCDCGKGSAAKAGSGPPLKYTPKFGLDPIGQAIVRDREAHLDQEARIRRLERQIVQLQRIHFPNHYIPYPVYRDVVPQPIPDPFPDGFPFGAKADGNKADARTVWGGENIDGPRPSSMPPRKGNREFDGGPDFGNGSWAEQDPDDGKWRRKGG